MSAAGQSPSGHWADFREAGTLTGFRFLLWIYRVFGRWVFTAFLTPAMVYFMLRRGSARRASLDYLRSHRARWPERWDHRPGLGDVFRHFMQFGQSVLDKLLAWCMPISDDDFIKSDPEAIDRLRSDPAGQLIIGSHHGNLEFCRGFMQRFEDREVNVLLHDRHAANFVEMMRRINPESRMNVYQVADLDVGTILKLKGRIEQGAWLFIAGDRVPLSGPAHTVDVDFLGRPAPFPIGPYMLAQSLGCPVKFMFAYRYKGKVRIDVEVFSERLVLDRATRQAEIRHCAQRFADALAERCRIAPLQWFNFYDFWHGRGKHGESAR